MEKKNKKPFYKKWWVWLIVAFLGIGAIQSNNENQTQANESQDKAELAAKKSSQKESSIAKANKISLANAKEKSSKIAAREAEEGAAKEQSNKDILSQLVTYTNEKSAGPNKNYYIENGSAKLTGFDGIKPGESKFSSDDQDRSGTARAVLTYSQYKTSKGSRQGSPLEPTGWPTDNPKVAINYGLNTRIYHGYLYNRSHSIGDSLLGSDSYNSRYNFTTGTRPQNVGADQNGGMRFAEETVENYWDSHPDSNNTVSYETTPIYNENETIPRGSIIDIKSSDGLIDKEIVVINSVEGIAVDYTSGSYKSDEVAVSSSVSSSVQSSSAAPVAAAAPSSAPVPAESQAAAPSTTAPQESAPVTSGGWTVAPAGQVYVSATGRYYARVTNPGNYTLMSQAQADSSGYTRAQRGNQYARPY